MHRHIPSLSNRVSVCDAVHRQLWRSYLAGATRGAGVHLAEVGVDVFEEGRLAHAEANHAAVVRVVLAALAEEFPAQDVPAADRK